MRQTRSLHAYSQQQEAAMQGNSYGLIKTCTSEGHNTLAKCDLQPAKCIKLIHPDADNTSLHNYYVACCPVFSGTAIFCCIEFGDENGL